jgi:hypothetical protein
MIDLPGCVGKILKILTILMIAHVCLNPSHHPTRKLRIRPARIGQWR